MFQVKKSEDGKRFVTSWGTRNKEMHSLGPYTLTKPLECSLVIKDESIYGKGRISREHIATHNLPSRLNQPTGKEIRGVGSTGSEALKDLERLLLLRYEVLKDRQYCLSAEGKLQLDYFRAIIDDTI